MANTSVNLINLDFDSLKSQLKTYLESQDTFQDYDFEGSNISVLLDILSYNTYTNAFYLNMIGNEMFMDSAILRDSVVSHAKALNYIPRSFKSAKAVVDITVSGGNTEVTAITAPKGTSFTSRVDSANYTFVLDENLVLTGSNGTYTAQSVDLYEGQYVSESFVVDYSNTAQRFILNNQTIDTDSLSVISIEDNGANTLAYIRTTSLLDKNANSQIFFVQGAYNDRYEISFGDGVIGRRPKDGSVVLCEYRITNGELPNGAFKFVSDGSIDGYSNVSVGTVTAAIGGAISESVDSIKLNAPRYFTSQERAITTEDYENLLKINYPEVLAASAYGGEEVNPPQYGKVFVAVDIDQIDGVPIGKRNEYYNFLKTRVPISVEPVIVEPDIIYVWVNSKVKYNVNTTTLSQNDIKTLALSAISSFATTNLNDFKKTLRYSQFVKAIDNANDNIVGNETDLEIIRKITPTLGINQNIVVDFNIPLQQSIGVPRHSGQSINCIFSTEFTYQNKKVRLKDDADGTINIIEASTGSTITNIGTVNYDIGSVILESFNIQSYDGESLKIYARPKDKDIISSTRNILQIVTDDVEVTVEEVRV